MIETNSGKDSSGTANLLPAFAPASLLSPGDVQGAIAHEPLEFRKKFQGSWYLCGDASKEMYDLVSGHAHRQIALRVFAFETPVGAPYGIVSHQVQAHMHRFLLPLYEPRVGDFLLAMKGGRLRFQLGYDGSSQAAMLTAQTPVESELLPLLGLASPLERERLRLALGELPSVIAEMKKPSCLPKVGAEPVKDVSVSVVLPSQTLALVLDTR